MNKNINTIFTFNSGTPTSVVAIVGNKHYEADSSHANWELILEAVRNDNADAFVTAIDIKATFENYVEGNVSVQGGEVYFGNTKLHGTVINRVFDFMKNDLPISPLLKFINKLMQNPSAQSVNELYEFLAHRNLPITSEGNFLAYKGVKADFYSVTAGKLTLLQGKADSAGHIYNAVGETVECVRNQVNDKRDETCSYGLHCGSYEYAKGFSQGKLVTVEVNPADCVSVPSDHNAEKLRVSKYKVVSECDAPLNDVYVETEVECDGSCDGCKCDEVDEEVQRESDENEGYDAGYADGVDCEDYNWESAYDVSDTVVYADSFKTGYSLGYGDGVRDRA